MIVDTAWGKAPAGALGDTPAVPHTDFMASSTRTAEGPAGSTAVAVQNPGGTACAAVRSAAGNAGAASDAVDQRWVQVNRWGPNMLLAGGLFVSFATADLVMSRADRLAALGLAGAAIVLQVWWYRAGRSDAGPTFTTTAYYVLRWILSFALTWANPFMAFYAVTGYFGANRLLSPRHLKAGLFATAVTMAGSQAGGLPPRGQVGWVVFGAMLAINLSLVFVFTQLGAKEEERNRLQSSTIEELEQANIRLQQALDENAALHAQLLVQAREAGVADERRRLAAEIHDTIAQGLTGIIAQLQVVMGTKDSGAVRGHLEQAAALARHSLGEARRSVQNLAPAALEHHGLPEALEKTVAEWSERLGVPAAFTVTGTVHSLHDEIEATVLRIAQEALSNTARHATAHRVGVTLSYMDDEVTLDVRDDGRGFDPLALPPRSGAGGFGLDGMRARAERIAGTLCVESEPGHGTAVSARVPLVPHDR